MVIKCVFETPYHQKEQCCISTPGRWTASLQIIKDDVNSFSSISDICCFAVTALQHVQGQHLEELKERCPLPDFEYPHMSEQMYTLWQILFLKAVPGNIFYGKKLCLLLISVRYSVILNSNLSFPNYIRWEKQRMVRVATLFHALLNCVFMTICSHWNMILHREFWTIYRWSGFLAGDVWFGSSPIPFSPASCLSF